MVMNKFKVIIVAFAILSGASAFSSYPGPGLAPFKDTNVKNLVRADTVDYRLRNESVPIHYDLYLETDIHIGDFYFNGTVEITIETRQSTSMIVMNSKTLTFYSIGYKLASATDDEFMPLEDYDFDLEAELLIINVGTQLPTNTQYIFRFEYQGYHGNLYGFYQSSYVVGDERKYLATTQFQAVSARLALPCYDEPRFRATFSIRIKHIGTYSAISNMPGTSTPDIEDPTRTITTFETTPTMPTYLVAFIVSDFDYKLEERSRRPHRVFTPPNRVNDSYFALESSVLILDKLEDYFQVEYELPKMDQVAVPDFAAGAMENWGLVTYRTVYLLVPPDGSSYLREVVATIIAHEYAHQFFGNKVTPQWWSYLWLNEGYATFYENYFADMIYPDFKLKERFPADVMHYILGIDTSDYYRPMSYYVDAPNQVERLFDSIAYSKSGCVLRAAHYTMNEHNYVMGLNRYLSNVASRPGDEAGVATPEDLFNALQETLVANNYTHVLPAGVTINDIMNSWTTQSGHPILWVTRDYTTNETTIGQRRNLRVGSTDNENRYYIGYSFTTESEANFEETEPRGWLLNNNNTVVLTMNDGGPANNEWIIFNIQQTGLYRVHYDDSNWLMLAEELRKPDGKIGVMNRAQLLDDSYGLANYGHLDWEIMLEIQNSLSVTTDYVPWIVGERNLRLLHNRLRYTDINPYFENFARTMISRTYLKYANVKSEELTYEQMMVDNIAVKMACKYNTKSCLDRSKQLVEEEIANGTEIHIDLRQEIYCTSLQSEDDDIINYLVDKLHNADVASFERDILLNALGCARAPDHVGIAAMALGTYDFLPANRIALMTGIARNSAIGATTVFEILVGSIVHLKANAGGGQMASFILNLAETVGTVAQRDLFFNLLDLMEPTPEEIDEFADLNEAIEQSRVLIDANLKWVTDNGPAIKSWLVENYDISFAPATKVSVVVLAVSMLLAFILNM